MTGVLDESYMAFAQRRRTGVLNGVIRLGSLTKVFCIPGLRLGYAVADTVTIQQLEAWLPPWPANTLALHLLPLLLREADRRDTQTVQARERLTMLLSQHDWEVLPSRAGFVLARSLRALPDFAAHRILVRSFPEWPQLQGWLRFGLPGDEAGWRRLEAALCR
jgi:cobalamin biosynthetic protein CobC